MRHIGLLALFFATACVSTDPDGDFSDNLDDDTTDDTDVDAVIAWPDTPVDAWLSACQDFSDAVSVGDGDAASAAWDAGVSNLVAEAEAATGQSWSSDIQDLLTLGIEAGLIDAEALVNAATIKWMKTEISAVADAYPEPVITDEDLLASLANARSLFQTLALLVAMADASPIATAHEETIEVDILDAFDDGYRAIEGNDPIGTGSMKQRVEKNTYRAIHRYVLAEAERASDANPVTPELADLMAARRALRAYELFADRLYDANPDKAKHSAGHYAIVQMLSGPPDAIDPDAILTALNVAFSKRTFAYTTHAADNPTEYLGTPSGAVKGIEGRTYFGLIAPDLGDKLGVDPADSLVTWDAYIVALQAGDQAEHDANQSILASQVCDYMVAIEAWPSAEACATGDGPGFWSTLDPNATPTQTWDWSSEPVTYGPDWASTLSDMKSAIGAATADAAQDHQRLEDAWAEWVGLSAIALDADGGATTTINAAFDEASVFVQSAEAGANPYWRTGASKQVIEKTTYRVFHRAILKWADEALINDDDDARDLAWYAYEAIRDRVVDENPTKSKNSLGDTLIEAMLTGPTGDIDTDVLERELNIAFAKRTLKYTRNALPEYEGNIGTPAGSVTATEGRTYWGLIAPYTGEDEATLWAAWGLYIDAVRANDVTTATEASAIIETAVCDYMQGDLGLTNCATEDTATEDGS